MQHPVTLFHGSYTTVEQPKIRLAKFRYPKQKNAPSATTAHGA